LVVGCPSRTTRDVLLAMAAAEREEKGQWPAAGGWLDQTQKCLDAVDFIQREQADWERRRAKD
jgi:hypothetical protein